MVRENRQSPKPFKIEVYFQLTTSTLANYVGKMVMLDRYYGLQLIDGRAIVHDLSIIKLPQPSSSVIEVSYDNGVAAVRP